jgi:hypothetical protein
MINRRRMSVRKHFSPMFCVVPSRRWKTRARVRMPSAFSAFAMPVSENELCRLLVDAAQDRRLRAIRHQALHLGIVIVAVGHLAAGPETALRLLNEFQVDLLGRVLALILVYAHHDVVLQPAGGRLLAEVLGGAHKPASVLAEESTELAPFVRAAQPAFEFEDEHDLDRAGLDLAHQRLHAWPVQAAIEEEILCTLTRLDQRDKKEFVCYAYVSRYGVLNDDIIE